MLWVTSTIVGAGTLPEPQQLEVEPLAAQRIERAERLVEQEHAGLERERPGQGDPLALPPDSSAGRLPSRRGRGATSSVRLASRSARRGGGQPASSSG